MSLFYRCIPYSKAAKKIIKFYQNGAILLLILIRALISFSNQARSNLLAFRTSISGIGTSDVCNAETNNYHFCNLYIPHSSASPIKLDPTYLHSEQVLVELELLMFAMQKQIIIISATFIFRTQTQIMLFCFTYKFIYKCHFLK